ncbi:MAG: hypothetical protein ABJN84_07065 [Flavobacteriaceae bacterium]
MIANLPSWIEILFLITCLVTIVVFHYANGKPRFLTLSIIVWSILQSILAFSGFYQETEKIPPPFALVLLLTTLFIILGLTPKALNWMVTNRDTRISTFLHTIRVPVEIVLLYLFIHKMIPELMTFEGRNFDILAGLTAPIVGILYFKNKISKKVLMLWNVIGLVLVSFILINGILSAELPFQQFGFEQPNRGINYFPFVLLPATIVPIVIYTHLTDIIKLRKELKS